MTDDETKGRRLGEHDMSDSAERHVMSDAPESLRRVTHDLKNLLGVVLGFTEVILADLASDDPRREDLLEIKKAGEEALALTTRIPVTKEPREDT